MPISRGDTIWLYASDAFFRNITSPHYRIEMARRLQAASDIDLVQLARLAAASEGKPGETIEQLKSAGLLPPEFGPLPGGSRVVLEGNEVFDSSRGRRGAFLPVADMPVDKVTQAEVSEYNKFADFYRTNWGRMDPIIAGVKRTALKDNREQVVVDVLMSPFAPQHFALFKQRLGPADRQQFGPDRRQHGDVGGRDDRRADLRRALRHGARRKTPARPVGSCRASCANCWSATSARPANWGRWPC